MTLPEGYGTNVWKCLSVSEVVRRNVGERGVELSIDTTVVPKCLARAQGGSNLR